MVMKPRPDETCYTIAISKLARSKGDRYKAGEGIALKSHEIL